MARKHYTVNQISYLSLTSLREHLCAHKAVQYRGRSFLYFTDFIHEFHVQIINFV